MTLRRVIQSIFLALFFFLFFTANYSWVGFLPHDLFLRADPLAAIVTTLALPAKIGMFAVALLVVASALLMGRAFCGYVCPLGTVFDAGSRVAGTRQRGATARLSWRALKYGILAMAVVSGLVGTSLLAWVDPIVLLTRTTAVLLDPWILGLGNTGIELLRPLANRLDWVALANTTLESPAYRLVGLSMVLMGAIVGFSVWRPRLWCRYLCPLGALLGVLGKWAPLRRRVSDACTECGACQRACPLGAIEEDPHLVRQPECVFCQRCADSCPVEAIHFVPGQPAIGDPSSKAPVLSRRGLLTASCLGLLLGLTAKVDARRRGARDRLIRPPGALPEEAYLNTCLRCGLCMGACLTHTLQPALWGAGWEGIWSPRLDLRLAPCEQQCNVCGQVCPTGAIRPLQLEERIHAKIGTAILLRERCLVWEQDKMCLICDEICPYDAIEFREAEGMQRPFVTESRCNGCGQCEYACPLEGDSAIVIVRMGEMRLLRGSYRSEARRMGYVFEGAREQDYETIQPPEEEQSPPGFSLDFPEK